MGRLISLITLFFVALVSQAHFALSAPPRKTSATGMTLSYHWEGIHLWPESDCLHEDSAETWIFDGTLGPGESFSFPVKFCLETDPIFGGPGGTSLIAKAIAQGLIFTIISPRGHHYDPLKMSSQSICKLTRNKYSCLDNVPTQGGYFTPQDFNPIYQYSRDTLTSQGFTYGIEGGTWTFTISNPTTIVQTAQLDLRAEQAPKFFYKNYKSIIKHPVEWVPFPKFSATPATVPASGTVRISGSGLPPFFYTGLFIYNMSNLGGTGPWGPTVSTYYIYSVIADASGNFSYDVSIPVSGSYYFALNSDGVYSPERVQDMLQPGQMGNTKWSGFFEVSP
jgi:hypothetical protein